MRLIVILFAVALVYGTWWARRARGARRLREIDAGTRCVACDRTDVASDGRVARCRACGHANRLAALQAVQVSAQDVKDLNQPDGRRGLS